MKKFLVSIFLVTFSLSLFSQVNYDKRIEIEIKDGYTSETIHHFGKDGFILQSRKTKEVKGKKEWSYQLYNTDLEVETQNSIKLSKSLYYDENFTDKERNYTLFKDRKGNFTIVTVNAKDCEITVASGVLPKKCRVKEMSVLGDYAYFNSTIKRNPYLFSINWKTGKQKSFPIYITEVKKLKNVYLDNFQLLEETNEVMCYVKAKVDKKKIDTYVIRLDAEGNQKEMFNLTKNIEQNIIDLSAQNVGEDKFIYTGTYATKSVMSSEGIFFCESEEGVVNYINFHEYLELDNFLSYMSDKAQAKIKKKKQKKEAKGKSYNFLYRIAAHDIIRRDDGYIFIGEAYYPTYRTEYYTSTVNGVTTTKSRQVFDGYYYTHALVAKFSFDGELEWDETFELRPSSKPFYVKRFISIAEDDGSSVNMVFVNRERIVTKVIDNDGEVKETRESEPLETNHSGDKAKWTFSNIDYWYGNTFIAYGSQKIKNTKDKSVKRKRKVYFISKISFE
jgi:hypothetical protein